MREAALEWIRDMLEADLSDIFDPNERPRPVADWAGRMAEGPRPFSEGSIEAGPQCDVRVSNKDK